jgi:hypothetical protein
LPLLFDLFTYFAEKVGKSKEKWPRDFLMLEFKHTDIEMRDGLDSGEGGHLIKLVWICHCGRLVLPEFSTPDGGFPFAHVWILVNSYVMTSCADHPWR